MSDETAQPCVRGCVAPCGCTACQECEQPIHPPQHRPREEGLLCDRCAVQLRRWLVEIPELYATLDPYERPAGEEYERHGRHKISGSPSLVRLDVVALMDQRTVPLAKITPGVDPEPPDGLMDVAGVYCSWAGMFVEEQGLSSKVSTLTEASGVLTAWLPTLCDQPWIDECWAEMRDIVRQLHRAHGDPRPKPIGRCINVYQRGGKTIACDAMLYAPDSGAKIRCGSCGRRYDGYGLIALGESLGVT
jgi:hypothetical protein